MPLVLCRAKINALQIKQPPQSFILTALYWKKIQIIIHGKFLFVRHQDLGAEAEIYSPPRKSYLGAGMGRGQQEWAPPTTHAHTHSLSLSTSFL